MQIKNRLKWIVVAMAASAVTAHADRLYRSADGAFYSYADVTNVEPIVRIVEVSRPETTCWQEPPRHQARYRHGGGYRSFTPLLIGGIVGGVVGHQFGGGRGKDVMTVAGSLLGASIGRDAADRHRAGGGRADNGGRYCEVTEVVHQEERLDGYRVTYRFEGRQFVTRTAYDPGNQIRVRVQVDPAAYN